MGLPEQCNPRMVTVEYGIGSGNKKHHKMWLPEGAGVFVDIKGEDAVVEEVHGTGVGLSRTFSESYEIVEPVLKPGYLEYYVRFLGLQRTVEQSGEDLSLERQAEIYEPPENSLIATI